MSAYEWLVRQAVFPAHERLRGRPTLRELAALRRLARCSPQEIEATEQQRLQDLLQFAARELPFYAERFARHGVNPYAADAKAELAKLPVLHKPEVRANADRMTWPAVPGGLVPCVSGGTTGDTLHFFIDRLRAAQSMAARLFMQSLFGVRPGDRRMWVWASPIELKRSRFRHWRDRLINEIVLDAFDMSAATLDAYVRRMIEYQPRAIIGYTSAVALLAQHAARTCSQRDFRDLRLVVLTADEVQPEERSAAQAAFGCPVASEYGSREVGLIAHHCPHGRMHIISPHLYVEITHENSRLPAGQLGDVTCTNLNTRAQPLIRYSLGDLGALSASGCPCGLPFPVMEVTAARVSSFVALPGGKLCSGHIIPHLVRSDPCITHFKVYQHALDLFEVLLVVDETFTPDAITRLQHRFRQYFGAAVQVQCRVVEHIPPDPSGKRRQLISAVSPEYRTFELVAAPQPDGPRSAGKHLVGFGS
jgi:phenylacetate-CoA ligase